MIHSKITIYEDGPLDLVLFIAVLRRLELSARRAAVAAAMDPLVDTEKVLSLCCVIEAQSRPRRHAMVIIHERRRVDIFEVVLY